MALGVRGGGVAVEIVFMALGTLDYSTPNEFDTGRFVARYLQVLAWFSIASMIAAPICFSSLRVDLTPIFLFWAASGLMRRSQTARKWVLGILGVLLALLALMLAWALVVGTHYLTVSLGAGRIRNPALWQVLLVVVLLAAVFGVPFVVLMSARARRQFKSDPAEQ